MGNNHYELFYYRESNLAKGKRCFFLTVALQPLLRKKEKWDNTIVLSVSSK